MTDDYTGIEFALNRARNIAIRTIEKKYDPLLACREIAALEAILPPLPDEILDVLSAVSSETDQYPLGVERLNWDTAALYELDLRAARYRESIRNIVEHMLKELLIELN